MELVCPLRPENVSWHFHVFGNFVADFPQEFCLSTISPEMTTVRPRTSLLFFHPPILFLIGNYVIQRSLDVCSGLPPSPLSARPQHSSFVLAGKTLDLLVNAIKEQLPALRCPAISHDEPVTFFVLHLHF